MTSFNNTINFPYDQKEPELQTDGPYVNYAPGNIIVNYIVEKKGIKRAETEEWRMDMKSDVRLNVMTDIPGKFFHMRLKEKIIVEKSEFPAADKLLVLSDIEGNFGAFRRLLQANKVIDEKFNWTFGKGQVVLAGDFFDRGDQVTEVLWLIYHLEEKAKSAGGYVHFILGNHELMNLTGDLRYTPQKYLDNAKVLRADYLALYDDNSELGRWLRTKNVIEKIGDLLILHGGISSDMNRMHLSLEKINELARPYLGLNGFDDKDENLRVIFGDFGPFWYRGYYDTSNSKIPAQIDMTLAQYGAKRIITGHTIVSNYITVWYNGRLLDTDVPHAEGSSEALLIEGGKYFRVNSKGKTAMLIDDK